MNDFCRFLENDLHSQMLRCGAGVNFSSVGTSRELCQTCSLSNLGNVPLCPHIEVYTFLSKDSTGAWLIQAEFECFADPSLPSEERCQNCPNTKNIETWTSEGESVQTLP
jgi:hypothetical protein